MTNTLSVSKAREEFAEVVNQAYYAKARITVTKHGKGIAAIVPLEDLELLLQFEAHIDLDDARKALKEANEMGTVSWEELKDELDL